MNTLYTSSGLGIAVVQIFLTLTSYKNEASPQSATPYGKFVTSAHLDKGVTISGRDNMLLIYTPALLLNAIYLYRLEKEYTITLLTSTLTLHFLKRVLETLFLHKYSTKVNPGLGAFIGIYYAAVCWIILHFHKSAYVTSIDIYNVSAGITFFIFGETGNFYHHFLLARLRDDSNQEYKIPRGGLFAFVTCPHYLFELIAWLGIALISQEVHSFLVLTSMSSYLMGRSVAQTKWAQKNIKNYPKDRKNIVPFIF